jgi:hypothetical protein
MFAKLKVDKYSNGIVLGRKDELLRITTRFENELVICTDTQTLWSFALSPDEFELVDEKELDLHKLSEKEINHLIWSGRGVSQHVGLTDVFTLEQLQSLFDHPDWNMFDRTFRNWVTYTTLD